MLSDPTRPTPTVPAALREAVEAETLPPWAAALIAEQRAENARLRAENEALMRGVRAALAYQQASEYAYALQATRFPDDEQRAALERVTKTYDALCAALGDSALLGKGE